MEVILQAMEYKIVHGNLTMNVKISNQNKITLSNHKGEQEFKFIGSNKQMTKSVGEMIMKAADLAMIPTETGQRV